MTSGPAHRQTVNTKPGSGQGGCDEAERVLGALADGGEITMPLEETFWAPRFGMCVDRFGTPWMINTEDRSNPRDRVDWEDAAAVIIEAGSLHVDESDRTEGPGQLGGAGPDGLSP